MGKIAELKILRRNLRKNIDLGFEGVFVLFFMLFWGFAVCFETGSHVVQAFPVLAM